MAAAPGSTYSWLPDVVARRVTRYPTSRIEARSPPGRRSVGLSEATALLLLYFNPRYLFILAVNIALIVGIAWMDWPSKTTVGA